MKRELLISTAILALLALGLILVWLFVPFESHQRSAGEPFRYSGQDEAEGFGKGRVPVFIGFDMDAKPTVPDR